MGPIERQLPPSVRTALALEDLFVHENVHDMPRVAIPRPETSIVVRFGPSAPGGLDVHAMGVRSTVQRKTVRRGQRTVMARLRLGATEAVLGVRASALAGRIVPLADLWSDAETRRLLDALAAAGDAVEAALLLERAIAERLALGRGPRAKLALAAAAKLSSSSIVEVANDLGVSERHLRRLFRDAVGLGPKAFAKLTRFDRAVRAARDDRTAAGWASIAASAGYYDQAHLIAEFRAIAGVTPRALIDELRASTPARSLLL